MNKKYFLCILFLFLVSLCFSQKLYFKKIEFENPEFENKLLTLSKELMELYKESDSLKFNDNYMRFQMLNKNYDGALKTLNNFRNIYKNSYPDYSRMAGIQFEIFILAKKASNRTKILDQFIKKFLKKNIMNFRCLQKALFLMLSNLKMVTIKRK
ncbi:hypothetical protein EAG08_11985 [Chryseobacterium sp. 3008163]|nr:hypothetical protein EAG08_11985 [Chryseobacterium sp. 3008163]